MKMVHFEFPESDFKQLGLRCEAAAVVTYDAAPLENLLLANGFDGDALERVTPYGRTELALAWYLHDRACGGACTAGELAAVRALQAKACVLRPRCMDGVVHEMGTPSTHRDMTARAVA